jgi:hypothetical protein
LPSSGAQHDGGDEWSEGGNDVSELRSDLRRKLTAWRTAIGAEQHVIGTNLTEAALCAAQIDAITGAIKHDG